MLWAFVFFPGYPALIYVVPRVAWWALPIGLYLGYCASLFAHSHNHCPTFKSRSANDWFSAWLSFFYGYPAFAWIPAHNQNHHKYVNRSGDAAITWRITHKNTFWMACANFFVSSHWQGNVVKKYLHKVRHGAPAAFRQILVQFVVVFGGHASMLYLALALYGVGRGLTVYAAAFAIPAFFALWSIAYTNYVQHVDCDPYSRHNHSRNFLSPLNNFLTFNNGFHTVHHEIPGAHWSDCPALHAKICHEIDGRLIERSILHYSIKAYLLRRAPGQVGRTAYDEAFNEDQTAAPAVLKS